MHSGNDEHSRSKRMHIYISLLKQMAPEHLLATFAKVCAEILAAASDGHLNIEDATGHSVLQVHSLYPSLAYTPTHNAPIGICLYYLCHNIVPASSRL